MLYDILYNIINIIDGRLDINEENLRVVVFLLLIDTAIFQLKERFKNLKYSENDIVKATYD
jgi:hypothetical protein